MSQTSTISNTLVRVLVAKDARLIATIKAFLNISDVEICCEVRDGLEAVKKCVELGPDLAVLTSQMGATSGFEAARRIQLLSPKTVIMVIGPNTAN